MLKETLPTQFPGPVLSVSITNDHLFMAFSIEKENIYIYSYDGTNFTFYQNISNLVSSNWKYLSLSQDHQHLTIAGFQDDFVKIYKNDGSSFK